jgi:hypothetical protein
MALETWPPRKRDSNPCRLWDEEDGSGSHFGNTPASTQGRWGNQRPENMSDWLGVLVSFS